jgi:hypothetical protein
MQQLRFRVSSEDIMLELSTSIRREHREKNLRISSLLRDRSTKENQLR